MWYSIYSPHSASWRCVHGSVPHMIIYGRPHIMWSARVRTVTCVQWLTCLPNAHAKCTWLCNMHMHAHVAMRERRCFVVYRHEHVYEANAVTFPQRPATIEVVAFFNAISFGIFQQCTSKEERVYTQQNKSKKLFWQDSPFLKDDMAIGDTCFEWAILSP